MLAISETVCSPPAYRSRATFICFGERAGLHLPLDCDEVTFELIESPEQVKEHRLAS